MMTIAIFGIVLFGAALHASWNAIVKSGQNTFLMMVLVTTSAAIFAFILLPFVPLPHSDSWPYILVSTILQILYFILIAQIYKIADMSQTYPLMRGAVPIIVALFGIFLLGEKLALSAWLGIIIISCGILFMLININGKNGKAINFAVLNAFIIAGYTLIDGSGARVSGSAIAYIIWVFFLTGIPILIWTLFFQYKHLHTYAQSHWYLGLIGGVGIIVSYGLAVWAMTILPIAIVAALRETSILFATLISFFILKEKINKVRIISSCLIVLGIIVLRLSFY